MSSESLNEVPIGYYDPKQPLRTKQPSPTDSGDMDDRIESTLQSIHESLKHAPHETTLQHALISSQVVISSLREEVERLRNELSFTTGQRNGALETASTLLADLRKADAECVALRSRVEEGEKKLREAGRGDGAENAFWAHRRDALQSPPTAALLPPKP